MLVPPQFHADELRFVENGCHDNPTLDVASDSQHEMRKKKPDSNGLSGKGAVAREEANRWQVTGTLPRNQETATGALFLRCFSSSPGICQVFVNQAAAEEQEEEEDTHL